MSSSLSQRVDEFIAKIQASEIGSTTELHGEPNHPVRIHDISLDIIRESDEDERDDASWDPRDDTPYLGS